VDACNDVAWTADGYNIGESGWEVTLGGEIVLAIGNPEYQAVERRKQALPSVHLDGAQVTVRPAQQSDVALIQEMHMRLSKESIQYRYLAPHTPDPEDLQRLCFLDDRSGVAIVATVQEPQEKVIAMACYAVDPGDPTTAEPAVLVEDSYQGRGVGKRILLALCQQARQMGLEAFECFTHLANDRVLRLIKGSGLRYESRYSRGVREFRVWLQPE
jgi:RimJ/RimL family protein N-acetyltransferase